jgi:molybdenum cofactor cytidylyltransferase
MSITDPSKGLSLGVVILAAGASSRMGRPKLLLPWGHTSVVGHLLEQWQTLPTEKQIAVVCAEAARALLAELDRLDFPPAQRIFNPQPERGMFSSIQCAANWDGWQPGLTHWAISLGDQPLVRTTTLRNVLECTAARPDSICQPSRNGRGRHPVILPAAAFARLRNCPDDDLKQFLAAKDLCVGRCEMDDPGLDLDLDEPSDYQRARALASKSAP